MRAKKPGRFVGLVVLLAVMFGGVNVGSVAADKTASLAIIKLSTTNWEWE
jgi:hypothetical protein